MIVTVGSGGVGKTTTAAAIGVAAARRGRRVLCLTIDPAKRLANSLGLEKMTREETLVAPEIFARVQGKLAAREEKRAPRAPKADLLWLAGLVWAALGPKRLTVLDYAPAVDTNGFVVTKETADNHKLRRLSDLAAVAGHLVLGGPPECPDRPFCLPGLRQAYGISFKDFKALDAGGPLTVAALEGRQKASMA